MPTRWTSLLTPLLAACVILGCQSITDPSLPAGARPMSPPEVYAQWWAMTEACSGKTGDFSAIAWYEVPNSTTIDLDGHEVAAYWSQAGNQIVLTGRGVMSGPVVRHEMLHALVRNGGHPRDQFLVRCGGLVECPGRCIEDAGPPPAPQAGTVTVLADALERSVVVGPVLPTHTEQGDVFSVTVAVRNPSSHPVVVTFPLTAGSPLADGFLYELGGPFAGTTGGVVLQDASRWTFAPGETKWQVFDFSSRALLGEDRFPAGEYRVRGAYGGKWSGYAAFPM